MRSLKVDGNERLRGCLPLDPCQSTARQREGEQGLIVEASFTEVTDCSCPDDEAAAYPPYAPFLPPPPPPPLNPSSPPPVLYEYFVRGSATLGGYTADTFGAAERESFASGVASVAAVVAEAVSVTSVRQITITSTAAAADDGSAQRTVTMGDEVLTVGAAKRAGGGRRLLGSDTSGDVPTEAVVIDFVVAVSERITAEAVIASVIAAAQPGAEGAATLLDALVSAGLSSLASLRVELEPEVESRPLESLPPPPPPLLPAADVDPDFQGGFDFDALSGIFDLFPWPVAAWPWIWVLGDGRWFTVVQIFTTLGTF